MTKNKIKVRRPIKLTIGCIFLVMSGIGFGTFQSMKYFLDLDGSSLWIPLTSLLFLFIGMIFLLYRDDQLNPQKNKENDS